MEYTGLLGEFMFTKKKINDYITQILCPGNVYVYLVEGKEKALLIDSGCGAYDLKGFIATLTNKPYDLVLTHGHVDHAGGAGQFETVYLSSLDYDLLEVHTSIKVRQDYLSQNGQNVDASNMISPKEISSYRELKEEQIFDLGNVSVQAFSMKGHTNGSMALLIQPCRTILFGDACNSLTFLQFEDCISLEEYANNLKAFKEKVENQYDLILYSHPHNYGGKEILDEMIDLCNQIISKEIEGVPFTPGTFIAKPINPTTFRRTDGKIANMAYLEKNIYKKD